MNPFALHQTFNFFDAIVDLVISSSQLLISFGSYSLVYTYNGTEYSEEVFLQNDLYKLMTNTDLSVLVGADLADNFMVYTRDSNSLTLEYSYFVNSPIVSVYLN